jgi:sugar lactone lactonase YvrE
MQFSVLASGYGLVEAPTVGHDGRVYFSDVLGGGVYCVSPDCELETVVPKRRGVGGLALHADGGVVCSGRDIVHVHDGVSTTLFAIDGLPGWNDFSTDAQGRIYAGALRFAVFDRKATPVPGELWRIDGRGDATRLYGDVVHPNGVALAPDERTLYHSDTRSNAVVVHTVRDDGSVGDRRAMDTSGYGPPDGLAVDDTGALWVALLDGFGLGRFTPDGRLERRVEVPASVTTSVCLHGHDLYVTTADNTDDAALRGCLLHTEVEVAGAPVHPARI